MKPRTNPPPGKPLVEEYRAAAAKREVPPGWVPHLWAKHLRVRAFLNREFDPEVADVMELWAEAVEQRPDIYQLTTHPTPPDPKRYFAPPSVAATPPTPPSSSPKKTFRY